MTRDNRHGPAGPVEPAALAAELKRERGVDAARRADELARERAQAAHTMARADVAEASRHAELARGEREEQAAADAELARMYRQFRAAGERTRIRSQMARSGEARALRLEQLRSRNLLVLVPLLAGFGIWSTTGVQQGAARLMNVTTHSPVWWVLWGLEALLIGVVCWIIMVRARLSSAGGELGESAERTMFGCLTLSIFLNLVAAVPIGNGPHISGWAVPGAMFAHAIGPVGAAAVAHLIGTIDKSISDADPWHEDGSPAPRLADMGLDLPAAPAVSPAALLAGEEDRAGPEDSEQFDPEGWVVAQGRIAAEQIAAWLADQQPPQDGAVPPLPAPRVDGPQGAARQLPSEEPALPVPAGGQIDAEQDVRIDAVAASTTGPQRRPAGPEPALAARRTAGEVTRRRVAEYLADYPDATVEQAAAALRLSKTTIKRHRRALRDDPAQAGTTQGADE